MISVKFNTHFLHAPYIIKNSTMHANEVNVSHWLIGQSSVTQVNIGQIQIYCLQRFSSK